MRGDAIAPTRARIAGRTRSAELGGSVDPGVDVTTLLEESARAREELTERIRTAEQPGSVPDVCEPEAEG